MSFFDADNIRTVMHGRWIQRPEKPLVLEGVGTDSRADLTARAFVALRGDRFDGNEYLAAAAKAGAPLLIADVASPSLKGVPASVGVFHVDDSRKALARLAAAYRKMLPTTKVIAVTGSCGKTTTKRLIHATLSTSMEGTASPKSFNNDVGVPLTLLNAKSSDRYLIVEVGTNAPGEISHLGSIVAPDLAVITSVGHSHLAGFGTVDSVAAEKASLLRHLRPDGVAVLTADAPALRVHFKQAKTRVLFGESSDADLRLTGRGANDDDASGRSHRGLAADRRSWWFEVNGKQRFNLGLAGRHNALNALAAVAIARRFGLDDGAISHGLGTVEPEGMRLAPQRLGSVTVFNDAYNANPESMAAALQTFAELADEASRRVVILGDMLELGEASPELHKDIARRLLAMDEDSSIKHAILIGEQSAFTAAELTREWRSNRVTHFSELNQDAMREIAAIIKPNDAILLKASRGMQLERLLVALEDRFGPGECSKSAAADSKSSRAKPQAA